MRPSNEDSSALDDEDVPFFMAETLDGLAALVSVTDESDAALLARYRVEVRGRANARLDTVKDAGSSPKVR